MATHQETSTNWADYSFLPIQDQSAYNLFNQQYGNFWLDPEVKWGSASSDFKQLSAKSQRTVKFLLAFFSQFDGLIGEALDDVISDFSHFKPGLPKEAKNFYRFQNAIEVVHNKVYAQNIEHYIQDPQEKKELMDGISKYASIKALAEWLKASNSRPIEERIIIFALVEGVWFSGLFGIPYWIRKTYGQLMEGLTMSNEWISRDEGIHRDFGVWISSWLARNHNLHVSQDTFNKLLQESMSLVRNFYREALPEPEHDLNANDLIKYVEVCADNLAIDLGFNPVFEQENPYMWLLTVGLMRKTNFFEKPVSEYNHSREERQEFKIDYKLISI